MNYGEQSAQGGCYLAGEGWGLPMTVWWRPQHECLASVVAACPKYPCIDLREADTHHHVMSLNADMTADIKYYSTDECQSSARSWARSQKSKCPARLPKTAPQNCPFWRKQNLAHRSKTWVVHLLVTNRSMMSQLCRICRRASALMARVRGLSLVGVWNCPGFYITDITITVHSLLQLFSSCVGLVLRRLRHLVLLSPPSCSSFNFPSCAGRLCGQFHGGT